ncbi:MAG: hypothetical protein KGO50_15335 [Myxococcales bacterium]|nr:hypothetical protein [Myxococcales bacterium]
MKIKKKAPLKASDIKPATPAGRAAGVSAPVSMRAQTTAQAAQAPAARTVTRVVGKEMIAYLFHKEWARAVTAGDYEFIWDMTHEDGALRAEYGPREEFQTVARRRLRLLKGISSDAQLGRIRLNGHDEAHLLVVDGLKARERRDYTIERWVLLRGELGWRVMQIDAIKRLKETSFSQVQISDFPAFELPEWFIAFRDARDAERKATRLAELAAREERRKMKELLSGEAKAEA